jgi:hypothetical protein
VDVNLAIVAACAVLLVGSFLGAMAAAYAARGRSAEAELQLERDRRERAEALAEHRRQLLEEAKRLLADAHDDAEEVLAGRAAVDEARRAAAPGDRLDAVERLLRAHADRRARRAAAAAPAGPGAPAAV